MKKVLFEMILLGFVGLMLFTALELSARILVTVLPALDIGARFKLTRKGPRGFPSFPDHDLNGFRNPENHDTVCIAALGDSQVYGTDVSYEFAWPFQLEKLLALPVLNAAIPGWGTIHQYMALDEVMAKKPKLVISLFYTGNDLLDNLDGEALLDPTKPLPPKDWKFRLTFPRIKNYLVSHLYIVKLTDLFIRKPWLRRGDEILDPSTAPCNSSKLVESHDYNEWCINIYAFFDILQANRRLPTVNLMQDKIHHGLDLAFEYTQKIHRYLAERSTAHLVLIMNTKEYVYEDLIRQSFHTPDETWLQQIYNERKITNQFTGYLKDLQIPYIEVITPLARSARMGKRPYLFADGHPNSQGHAIVAKAISEHPYVQDIVQTRCR